MSKQDTKTIIDIEQDPSLHRRPIFQQIKPFKLDFDIKTVLLTN